jgi:hypothetical protein
MSSPSTVQFTAPPDRTLNFAIDLPIQSEWPNVELVRNAILGCFRATFAHLECCERMAMIAGELMENAIKYGRWSDQQHQLRLHLRGDQSEVEIAVEAPVDPTSPRVTELFATLDWMEGFPTAAAAYQARVLAIAENPHHTGSKLGLVRIAHEGGCHLRAELSGPLLRVTGVMNPSA